VEMSVILSMGTVSSQGSASATWGTLVLAVQTASSYQAVRMATAGKVLSVGVRKDGQACSAQTPSAISTARRTMAFVQDLVGVSVRGVTVGRTVLSVALCRAVRMELVRSHWSALVKRVGREPSVTSLYVQTTAVENTGHASHRESAGVCLATRGRTAPSASPTQAVLMVTVSNLTTATVHLAGQDTSVILQKLKSLDLVCGEVCANLLGHLYA